MRLVRPNYSESDYVPAVVSEEADNPDEGLDAYDRIVAASFPASDPPPGPLAI